MPNVGDIQVWNGTAYVPQQFLQGNLAVGFASAPGTTYRFDVLDGTAPQDLETWFTANLGTQGSYGWSINKKSKSGTAPHVVTWLVGGKGTWELGQDFDTNNTGNGGTGNSDFVLLYDYTAGKKDDGTGAGTGSDLIRISPAEAASDGYTRALISYRAGSPRTFTSFLTVEAGKDASGLNISCNHTTASPTMLNLTQRATSHKRAVINYNNLWVSGTDIGAANLSDFALYDSVNGKTRLFVKASSAVNPQVGVGSANPQGMLSVKADSGSGSYDTVQTYFNGSYADTLSNRAINAQVILDASHVKNYLFLNGNLGAGSTAVTPVVTSDFASTFGLESSDTQFAVITAAAGANKSIIRAMTMDNTGKCTFSQDLTAQAALKHTGGTAGFFGVTPAAQQAGGAATAGASYGANEQSMLQKAYNCLRTFGLLS